MISTVAPATGAPVAIDCTNTSCEPSTERFTTRPRSVTTSRRASRQSCRATLFQLSPYSSAAASSRIPRLHAHQEDAASVAAVRIEVLAEVDRFVLRLARTAPAAARSDAHEALGDVRRVERPVGEHAASRNCRSICVTRCCSWRGSRRSTSTRIARTLRANRHSVFSPDIDSSEPWCRMLSSRGNSGTRMMRSTASPSCSRRTIAGPRRSSRRRSDRDRPRSAGCAARSARARRGSA